MDVFITMLFGGINALHNHIAPVEEGFRRKAGSVVEDTLFLNRTVEPFYGPPCLVGLVPVFGAIWLGIKWESARRSLVERFS